MTIVLVLLFGNFLQPLTILFSLPLSIGGAILGLLVFSKPISMPVVIGILIAGRRRRPRSGPSADAQ